MSADVRELSLSTGSSVDDAFPLVIQTGEGTVLEVRCVYIENLTDPSADWTGGVYVFWRKGQKKNTVELRFISGLASNTSYRLKLAIERE